ncbi:MAG TPA: DUF3048 domain-containing protein, partial [Planctomycetaceae bacterium]
MAAGCGKGVDEPVSEGGSGGTAAPATPPVEEPPPPPDPELPGAIVVMVENHEDARPQSGLEAADVVYELEVEGRITRFMAVFYTRAADE